jgi:hypothetical protein
MKPKVLRINLRNQDHRDHCAARQTAVRVEVVDGDVIYKGQLVVQLHPNLSEDLPPTMVLRMSHCPNPDIGGRGGYWDGTPRGPKSQRVPVASFEEARLCVAYIAERGLGAGNWSGGEITDQDGKFVAVVSYNGRVWRGRDMQHALDGHNDEIRLNKAGDQVAVDLVVLNTGKASQSVRLKGQKRENPKKLA